MTRLSASDVTPRGEAENVTTSGIQKNLNLKLTNILDVLDISSESYPEP